MLRNALPRRKANQRRRRTRRLECETLEARVVLSGAPNWGINLDWNTDSGALGAWVDAGNVFRRWGDVDRPWEHESLTFTDQGIPLEDAGAISFLRGYGGGVYSLSYEGTGDVTFSHRARIIEGTLQTVDGVTTASVEVDDVPAGDPNELVYLHLRDVDPNDPVRDLRLIAPGYDVDTTQVFRDEFLKRLQPFSTVRFMDWNRTNSSLAADWSQRRQEENFIQTYALGNAVELGDPTLGGVAWEHMITLVNEVGADAWINVPHLVAAEAVNNPSADDAGEIYIRELARLWRDNLDPGLKVIVEYSNEPWNSLFTQGQGDNWNYYSAVAPRLEKISDIFHEEFAGQEGRLEIVLSGQHVNAFHAQQGLQYFVDQGRAPSDVIDAVATAPYFGIGSQEFTDLDSLFDGVNFTMQDIGAHKALADQYGLKLYTYEGGQHFVPVNTSYELMQAAQSDPRMAAAYEHDAALWEAAGGDLFMHFTMIGSGNGFFGLLTDARDTGSVKWDAMMRILLPAGDSSLDGSVGFDDFETLRDNYATGLWWEQGDSDGDNDVDADDFFRLFHNLDRAALTTIQTDEIYGFAATNGISVPALDAPTVIVEASDDSAAEESGDTAQFTFTRDATAGPLAVQYLVGGTADSSDYYESLSGTLTFADGSSTVTLTITPVDDVEFDYGETLEITLVLGDDYFVGDPAEATITLLDDEALVYDGFDVPGGTLQGNASGWGWDGEWLVWLNDDANPEYQVVAGEGSIPHDELHTTGGYVTGSPASGEKHAGRALDLSGPLAEYVHPDTGQLGADGTTLWISTLVSKNSAQRGGPMLRVSLTGTNGPEQAWDYQVAMGYLRFQSDAGGVGYWSLQERIPGAGLATVRSDKPVVADEPTLLVMRIDFGAESDLATLYVDPELGVAPPAAGDAQIAVDDIDFKNLSFTTSRSAEGPAGSLDEFRIGATFASVTPSAAPTVVEVVADAGGPYSVDEGGSVQLDASATTGQPLQSLTFEWDLDGDGAFGETGAAAAQGDEVGVSPTFSATALDGPSSVEVSLLVTDPQGNSDTATAMIDVANAAPSLAVDFTSVGVSEGETAANVGTYDDPGGDTLTLTASIGTIVDHGDGTWTWSLDSADGPDDGQTVTITTADDDGEETSVTFSLSVQNVAPEITSLASSVVLDSGSPGGVVTIDGSFFDPALQRDTHTVTVDWGDGIVEPLAAARIDQAGDTFTAEHTYLAGGIYTIAVIVEDEDGGVSGPATADAIIQGVALKGGTLYVIGTDARDVIKVNERAGGAEIRVDARLDVNAGPPLRIRETYAAENVQSIVVYALGDDDDVNIAAGVSMGVTVFGGAGDDLIRGGGGDDLLAGGEGDDRIYGRGGDDLLVGGAGSDMLRGNTGDDLMIAGSTANSGDVNLLEAALASWIDDDLTTALFDLGAILDDGDFDELLGGPGHDELFGALGDNLYP